MSNLTIDLGLFAIANLFNLLVTGIMLSRPARLPKVERVLGVLSIALAFPLVGAVILNAARARELWTIALPIPLILFCVVEWVLDYVAGRDFRNTRLLGPYLVLFYLAVIGMNGYAFGVGAVYGFVTLGTYFVSLFATWYSYARVGHGRRGART